jgi:hypothetical protein
MLTCGSLEKLIKKMCFFERLIKVRRIVALKNLPVILK